MPCVSLAFAWERTTEKEYQIISLLPYTIAMMNAFFCRICFPSSSPPSSPADASNVSLLNHHLRCHPLPPCSKEQPSMTTGTGGKCIVHGHSHLLLPPLFLPFPLRGGIWGLPCHMMTTPSYSLTANQAGMTAKMLEGRIPTIPFIVLCQAGPTTPPPQRGWGRCNHSRSVILTLLCLPDYCRCPGPPIIVVWEDITTSSSSKEAICPDSMQNNNTLPTTTEPPGQTLFTASTNTMKLSRDAPHFRWHSSAMLLMTIARGIVVSKQSCLQQ